MVKSNSKNLSKNIKSRIESILSRQEQIKISQIPKREPLYDGLVSIICLVDKFEYSEIEGCPIYDTFLSLIHTHKINPRKTCLECPFYNKTLRRGMSGQEYMGNPKQ